MSIREVPDFPLRSDGLSQDDYSAGVEASLTALPLAIQDFNAAASAFQLAVTGTSTTSVLIGTGSKSFTTQTGLGFVVGMTLRIANSSTNYMTGDVTSYNSGTGALVVNVTSVVGSGTFASWTISLAAVGANTAGALSFTPAGNISATNVQTAIQELDTEKLSSAAGAVTTEKLADGAASGLALGNKIQYIYAGVADNTLIIALYPTTLDFRNAWLGTGVVNTRIITSTLLMTVSSGSTLGTVNATLSRLVVLAIDNAGTVELAVVNLAGGNQLDETNLISTTAEGGAGAADSATTIYSTTARSNVPYRVVGFIESTQATAGTWATAPSRIQGIGGQALAALSSYGNAIPVDVTGSRTTGTTYYNTRSRPINVMIRAILPNTGTIALTVNGVNKQRFSNGNTGSAEFSVSEVVGPGQSYLNTGNTAHNQWVET